jgi:hypothetical protein
MLYDCQKHPFYFVMKKGTPKPNGKVNTMVKGTCHESCETNAQ